MKKQLVILALCSAPLIFGMQADGASSTGPDFQADGSMCLKSPEALEKFPVPLEREKLAVQLRPETPQTQLKNIHRDLCHLWQEIGSENSNGVAGDRQQVLSALWTLQNTHAFLSLPQQEQNSLSEERYALLGYASSSK